MNKTKYTVKPTSQFKKDYKQAIKQNLDMDKLKTVIEKLANGEKLPDSNYDHSLSGRWSKHRECHIEPDWLLIYKFEKNVLVLTLSRTGTHSELFGR